MLIWKYALGHQNLRKALASETEKTAGFWMFFFNKSSIYKHLQNLKNPFKDSCLATFYNYLHLMVHFGNDIDFVRYVLKATYRTV